MNEIGNDEFSYEDLCKSCKNYINDDTYFCECFFYMGIVATSLDDEGNDIVVVCKEFKRKDK